jgi:putative transposase
MALNAFAVGQKFKIDTDQFVITRLLDNGWVQYEAIFSRLVSQGPINELLSKYSTGELVFYRDQPAETVKRDHKRFRPANMMTVWNDTFRQDYEEEEWNKAQAKLQLLKLLEGVPCSNSRLPPAIAAVWEKFKRAKLGAYLDTAPHFVTVARWRKAYLRAEGDIRALIERQAQKGNRDSRVPEEVERLIEDTLMDQYLVPEKVSISDIVGIVNMAIINLNRERRRQLQDELQRVTINLVRSRVRMLWSAFDLYAAKHGRAAAQLKFRAVGSGYLASKPLERASMDHTRMDLFVIDEETHLPLGRPWLTVIIDDCTRMVLGYSISFEPPSAVSVARALRHAMLPKTEFLKQFESVKGSWDAWGVIETLILDNGL